MGAEIVVEVKQHTEGTDCGFVAEDKNGDPIDLTTATVTLMLRSQKEDDDAVATKELVCSTSGNDPTLGQCHRTWASGDLSTHGKFDSWLDIVDGSEKHGNSSPFILVVKPAPLLGA